MTDVKNVIQISSSIISACRLCGDQVTMSDHDYVEKMVNHIIQAHGYKLLHVGMESDHHDGKQLWYSTVAVLGK